MEVRARFRRAVTSMYNRMAVEAEYIPRDGRIPFVILVVPRRPDNLFQLGEAHIHAEDPQLEFQSRQVTNPERGDDIRIGETLYRIEAEPRLEKHELVWVADVLPL